MGILVNEEKKKFLKKVWVVRDLLNIIEIVVKRFGKHLWGRLVLSFAVHNGNLNSRNGYGTDSLANPRSQKRIQTRTNKFFKCSLAFTYVHLVNRTKYCGWYAPSHSNDFRQKTDNPIDGQRRELKSPECKGRRIRRTYANLTSTTRGRSYVRIAVNTFPV